MPSEYVISGEALCRLANAIFYAFGKQKAILDVRDFATDKIVRCRDCKHFDDFYGCLTSFGDGNLNNPDGFCAWGEPSEVK